MIRNIISDLLYHRRIKTAVQFIMIGNDDIETLIDQPINAVDLFGEDEEEIQIIPPLSPNANEDEGTAGADGDATSVAATEIKKVRRINRLPNLNEKWITDPKKEGLYAVNKYFEKIKLKRGKGYELKNLKTILKRYEYWAQQCYPKLCFKDFIDNLENLSGKKLVKRTLQEIRTNTIPNSEFVEEGADDIDPGVNIPIDCENPVNSNVFPSSFQPITNSSSPRPITGFSSPQQITDSNNTIPDEMKEIIRRKREEAIAKRKRKLDESQNLSDMSLSQSNEAVENTADAKGNIDSSTIPQCNEEKTITTNHQQPLDSSYMPVSETNEEPEDCNPLELPPDSVHASNLQPSIETGHTDEMEYSVNSSVVSKSQPNEETENIETLEMEIEKSSLVLEEVAEVSSEGEPIDDIEKKNMGINADEISDEHADEIVGK